MKRSRKSVFISLVIGFLAIVIAPTKTSVVHSARDHQYKPPQDDGELMPFRLKQLRLGQNAKSRTVKANGYETDDPLSRMRAELEQHGRVTAAIVQKNLREARRQREQYSERFVEGPAERGVPSWQSLGPSSEESLPPFEPPDKVDSGRLRTILPHPRDPDTVYVLSSGGGLWKTTNFTSPHYKWRPLTDAIGTTAGGSVAFGSNPETLYLGTGDPFDGVGGFMVKSNNGGNTWSDPIVLGNASRVLEVKIDSRDSDSRDPERGEVVLVGTNQGLFRSSDGGRSYSLVAFDDKWVWSLVNTSAGWLASVQEEDQSPSGFIGFGPSSLYISHDRGSTWAPITNGGIGFANAGRSTLAVGKSGDSTVYAFAATPGDETTAEIDQLDLFRSTDGGQSWLPLHINDKTPVGAQPFQTNMDLMRQQAWYNQLILVDPTDLARNTVYLGGQLAAAKSTDGGNNWSLISNTAGYNAPYVHADCHTAAFTQFGGSKTVFFGTDGGIAISQDGGTTWNQSKNNGLVDQLIFSITASAIHPEETLIGLQDLGIRFRVGDSTVWNQVGGGDGLGVGWSQANDNESFCSELFDTYFQVLNNPPDDWLKLIYANDFSLPDYFPNFDTAITTPTAAGDPSGYVFVTYGPTFIYYTYDRSARWLALANIDEGNGYGPSNIQAGDPFTLFFRDQVHGLGLSEDTTAMGVAATGGNVVLSTDNENTWTTISLNSEVPDTTSGLGFHSYSGNVLWATNSDVYVTSYNRSPGVTHVVRSNQGGASGTWRPAQSGLPDVPVQILKSDPNDPRRKTIFAGTDLGVYRTNDGGDHWTLFGSHLPQVQVTDLYLPPDGSFLRISTYGRGVWEIPLVNRNRS